MHGPIKTQEKYEFILNQIYLLLQKRVRVNTTSYVKLGCYCVLVNHYQHTRMTEITENTRKTYNAIRMLLLNNKKKKMMERIGISILPDPDMSRILDRKTFRLLPEIFPGAQHL